LGRHSSRLSQAPAGWNFFSASTAGLLAGKGTALVTWLPLPKEPPQPAPTPKLSCPTPKLSCPGAAGCCPAWLGPMVLACSSWQLIQPASKQASPGSLLPASALPICLSAANALVLKPSGPECKAPSPLPGEWLLAGWLAGCCCTLPHVAAASRAGRLQPVAAVLAPASLRQLHTAVWQLSPHLGPEQASQMLASQPARSRQQQQQQQWLGHIVSPRWGSSQRYHQSQPCGHLPAQAGRLRESQPKSSQGGCLMAGPGWQAWGTCVGARGRRARQLGLVATGLARGRPGTSEGLCHRCPTPFCGSRGATSSGHSKLISCGAPLPGSLAAEARARQAGNCNRQRTSMSQPPPSVVFAPFAYLVHWNVELFASVMVDLVRAKSTSFPLCHTL